jgi:hypothetical protein
MASKRSKNTPWFRALLGKYNTCRRSNYELTEAEAMFVLLVWMGVPRIRAYQTAFPNSTADEKSIPQMACILFNSQRVRALMEDLCNQNKRKMLQFNYPRDMDNAIHTRSWWS